MELEPTVTFVVSSYNQSAFLGDCLDSILAQTKRVEFEIVLVDDASTDGTAELVRRYQDPRIEFVPHAQNTGLVSTLNDGFARARGDFVARIDGDDRYRRNYLERTLPILEKFPEVGMVYSDAALIDSTGALVAEVWQDPASRYFHGGKDFKGNEYLALIQRNFVPSPTTIARRQVWRNVFPIPEWIPPQFPAADYYLNLCAARRNEFYYLAETLAEYRKHGGNWHTARQTDRTYEMAVVRMFDVIFQEPEFAREKQAMRNESYANLYTYFANRYFGLGMREDARRCYRRAIGYRRELVSNPTHMRRWAATWLDPDLYGRLKQIAHGLRSK